MEPPKEYNLCEIYSKLSDCPIHHKPIEFVCTYPQCTKPRLACNKCLFDATHNTCMNKMVLLDDLLNPKCFIEPKDSLNNWISSEEHRQLLIKLQENLWTKNIDISLQEATCLLEAKWNQIENEVKDRVNEMLDIAHNKMMEMFKQSSNNIRLFKAFDSHFNPEKLIELFQITPLNDLNACLNNFFSVTSEEVFGKLDKNEKKGQENHYIWLMAKFKENLTNHIKKMEIEMKEELERFNNEISYNANGLININRFESRMEGMTYGNQKTDCISFAVSDDVLCHGISVYKHLTPDSNWNVLVMLIVGDKSNGQVLKKQLFRVKNNPINSDFIASLMFDNPVDIIAEKKYTVYVLINGPITYKGIQGNLVVKDKKLAVKFFETQYSEKDPKNATGVVSGQIPNIFFSLKEK